MKNISSKKDGNGMTIMTIKAKTAIGSPMGFNFSRIEISLPNVFVKFMTAPNARYKKCYKSTSLSFSHLMEARMMPTY